MRVTPAITEAMRNASDRLGSNDALAKATGLTGATIGRYRSGRIRIIKDDAWDRLEPVLRPFLRSKYPDYVPGNASAHDAPHPCDGRPDVLRRLCEHWDELPDETRAIIEATADVAVKKCEAKAPRATRVGAA
jgi:hypothetical protein